MRFFFASLLVVGFGCGDSGDGGGGGNTGGSPSPGGGDTGGSPSTAGSNAGGGGGVVGGGGAPASCGNSVIDEGEACDDGAESAECNADCTNASCGDGKRNRTAGEGCDDGNTADGDACSAGCAPSVMILSDASEGSVASATVAHSGGVFSTVWSTQALGINFRLATIGPAGSFNEADLGSTNKEYGFVSIASNSDGRAMIFGIRFQPADILWRFVAPGGALEAGSGGTATEAFSPTGPSFQPFFDKFTANASGEFCGFAGDGNTRCTQGDELLPPVDSLPGGGALSATLLDRGVDGYFVGYVAGPEFRSFTMDSDGNSTGPVVPLGSASFDARGGGGVVRPDGTFGVAMSRPGQVTWYPFDANGDLDAANVKEIGTPEAYNAELVSIPSGRFLLVWYEFAPPSTCSIWGRLFDENVEPLGEPFVMYEPEQFHCGSTFDVAANPVGDVALVWAESFQNNADGARAMYFPGLIQD